MKIGKTSENDEEFKFKVKAAPEDGKNKEAKIMKISVNSWHYKLVSLIHSPNCAMPSNFCSYARWLLFALFLVALVVALVAALLSYFVYGWVVFVMNFPEHGWKLIGDTDKYLKFFEAGAVRIAVTLTGLVAFLSVVVGAIWGITAILNFRAEAEARRWWEEREKGVVPKKPKEPGLVSLWLKAKKEKVCPMIEYTEE